MKTKEFFKRVKELGFRHVSVIDNDNKILCITIEHGFVRLVRILPQRYAISTLDYDFIACKDDLPLEELYKLCFEYAATPVKDREEEKKFYLMHKFFQGHIDCKQYFCIRISNGNPLLKGFPTPYADKIEFTLKEIEEIKEKFGTDLKDFELVEVEE